MNKKNKVLLILFVILVVFPGCRKFDQNVLLGTWISTDTVDTLEFVDDSNFYMSNIGLRHDHFDYHLDKDSIEIKYSGTLMIYVLPTKHKYFINDDTLTIDFRNKICYGFSQNEISFVKQ